MTTSEALSKSSDAAKRSDRVCGKHNTPLVASEERGEGDWGYTHYYCPTCEAVNAKEAAEKAARESRERLMADIPYHYQGAVLEQFDRELIAPVIEWVKNPRGFLYVTGSAGVGKTHLACAAKRSFNERGIGSKLVFSGDMFLTLRKSFGKNSTENEADIVARYAPKADRRPVIFDDVGAQKVSEYTADAWFNIIDRRYRGDAPTMITTNLSRADLAEALSVRVMSRICSGLMLELAGRDRRVKEHWTKIYD